MEWIRARSQLDGRMGWELIRVVGDTTFYRAGVYRPYNQQDDKFYVWRRGDIVSEGFADVEEAKKHAEVLVRMDLLP